MVSTFLTLIQSVNKEIFIVLWFCHIFLTQGKAFFTHRISIQFTPLVLQIVYWHFHFPAFFFFLRLSISALYDFFGYNNGQRKTKEKLLIFHHFIREITQFNLHSNPAKLDIQLFYSWRNWDRENRWLAQNCTGNIWSNLSLP